MRPWLTYWLYCFAKWCDRTKYPAGDDPWIAISMLVMVFAWPIELALYALIAAGGFGLWWLLR